MVRRAQFLILSQGCALAEPIGPWRLTYWKALPNTNIGKTNFASKNTAMLLYGYPICLVKNNP